MFVGINAELLSNKLTNRIDGLFKKYLYKETTIIKIGTNIGASGTIDVKPHYAKYTELTNENFYFRMKKTGAYDYSGNTGECSYSYNSSTGMLSITNGYNGGSNGYNYGITDVFLIVL